jgi:6-pyruvoyl-tetrahydropterin synthase
MKIHVTRAYKLSVAHFIPQDYVSPDQATLHGHEWKVAITLEKSQSTKRNWDAPYLDGLLKNQIENFQNCILNEHFSLGTGEVLAQSLLEQLRQSEIGSQIMAVQLIETRKNRFQGVFTNSLDKT